MLHTILKVIQHLGRQGLVLRGDNYEILFKL